jgi:hypothetical protein
LPPSQFEVGIVEVFPGREVEDDGITDHNPILCANHTDGAKWPLDEFLDSPSLMVLSGKISNAAQ